MTSKARSRLMKKRWQQPAYRVRMEKAARKSLNKRRNDPEFQAALKAGQAAGRAAGHYKHSVKTRARMSKQRALWWKTHDTTETRKKISANHARPALGKTGAKAPGWKGGRYSTKRDKYVHVYVPDHPYAKKSGKGTGGYVLEHRLVMEKILGRYLHPDEDVNYRNGVKDDNRPDNLRLVSHFAHFEEHGCPSCGFKFLTK